MLTAGTLNAGAVIHDVTMNHVKETKGTVYTSDSITNLYIPKLLLAGHRPQNIRVVITVLE